MSLTKICEQDFGTKSLYGVLGVDKTVNTKELLQAYRKASLFLLPALAPSHRLEEFCRKFEILSKVHYILSDESKREIYDKTGVVDASVDTISANFWTRYWRKLFPRLVPEDIVDFKERYKDSEEEKEDLKVAYLRSKGNMDRFAEIYFAYTAEDEDRISYIMNEELINRRKMRPYVKFINEKPANIQARKKKYKRPHPEDDPACINPIVLVLRQKRPEKQDCLAIENEEQRKPDCLAIENEQRKPEETARDEAPRRKRRR